MDFMINSLRQVAFEYWCFGSDDDNDDSGADDGWGGGWSNSGGSVNNNNHNGNGSRENDNRNNDNTNSSGDNDADPVSGSGAGAASDAQAAENNAVASTDRAQKAGAGAGGSNSTISDDADDGFGGGWSNSGGFVDARTSGYANQNVSDAYGRVAEINAAPEGLLGQIASFVEPTNRRANVQYEDGSVVANTQHSIGNASLVGSAVGSFVPGAGLVGSVIDGLFGNPFGETDLFETKERFGGGPEETSSFTEHDKNDGPVLRAGLTQANNAPSQGTASPNAGLEEDEEDDPLYVFRNALRGVFG